MGLVGDDLRVSVPEPNPRPRALWLGVDGWMDEVTRTITPHTHTHRLPHGTLIHIHRNMGNGYTNKRIITS